MTYPPLAVAKNAHLPARRSLLMGAVACGTLSRAAASWLGVASSMGVIGCTTPALKSPRLDVLKQSAIGPVLFVPPVVRMHEVTLGDREERVVAWEREFNQNFTWALEEFARDHSPLSFRSIKTLTPEAEQLVIDHQALFSTMVPQMLLAKAGVANVWHVQRDECRFSLGPGMVAVAEETGMEWVLMALGADRIRSTSRRVWDTVLSLNPLALGQKTQTGTLCVGMVQLRTGDVLWVDNAFTSWLSLNEKKSLAKVTHELLGRFYQKESSVFQSLGGAKS